MNELHPGSMRWQEREWLRSQPQEWWDDIFDRIACGEAASKILKDYNVRFAIFGRILKEDAERKADYESALEIASDGYAHQVIEIADDGSNDTYVDEHGNKKVDTDVLGRSKLRIESRLKLASKWHKKRYGDTVDVKHNVAAGGLMIVMAQLSPQEQEKVISPERVVAIQEQEAEAGEVVPAETPTGALPPSNPPRQLVSEQAVDWI